jgi:hypothetical protein
VIVLGATPARRAIWRRLIPIASSTTIRRRTCLTCSGEAGRELRQLGSIDREA